jgi:cytochrome P450
MAAAFSPSNIKNVWLPLYAKVAEEYIGRLPRGEVVDLHDQLSAPVSARCLAHLIGLTHASDEDLCRWSQTLIDGAGNFGWRDEPFERSDAANVEINACIGQVIEENRAEHKPNAISAMLHADDPLDVETIQSNIKIVIGGGINEPRDALSTCLFGLLTNPDVVPAGALDVTGRWAPVNEKNASKPTRAAVASTSNQPLELPVWVR